MTRKQWEKYKPYFLPHEFDSEDIPESGFKHMQKCFMDRLYKARIKADVKMVITNRGGYRSPAVNTKAGGVDMSSHMEGLASDIKCTSSRKRFKMLKAFIDVGFTRIGIGHTYIHVDYDKDKPQEVIWDYVK